MSKQSIKVIKRPDAGTKKPAAAKKVPEKKKRSVESTIQNWITERRENEATEDATRNSDFQAWDDHSAETV